MWIEIKTLNDSFLINSNNISIVSYDDKEFYINATNNEILIIPTTEVEDSKVIYEGFILALNGLDFIFDNISIKPLLQSKNEALYRHILLKEALSDRK